MPFYTASSTQDRQIFVDQVGDQTGMVFCPQRLSSIAVMRCGEYQEAYGCQFGCKSAATPKEIAAMRAALRIVEPRDDGIRKYDTCALCGKPKQRTKRPVGRCCSNEGKGAKPGAAEARFDVAHHRRRTGGAGS